jgi:hypothetical protein
MSRLHHKNFGDRVFEFILLSHLEVGNGFFITFLEGEDIEVEGWLGLTLDFL